MESYFELEDNLFYDRIRGISLYQIAKILKTCERNMNHA